MKEMTSILQQYDQLTVELNSRGLFGKNILLLQVGDFFETFGEQGKIFADISKITLTSKNGEPMAGVPSRNYKSYIKKLVDQGYNVAIAEQVETPAEAKERGSKLLKREISRVYSKGTWQDELGDYSFVMVLLHYGDCYYAIYGDHSTGEAYTEEIKELYLSSLLCRVDPAVLLSNSILPDNCAMKINDHSYVMSSTHGKVEVQQIKYKCTNTLTIGSEALKLLDQYFSSRGFKAELKIENLSQQYLRLGRSVLDNLEVFSCISKGSTSLMKHCDKTQSAMGRRRLKWQLSHPSTNKHLLLEYWDSVEKFLDYDDINYKIEDISKLTNNCDSVDSCYRLARAVQSALNVLSSTIDLLPRHMHHEIYKVNKLKIHETIIEAISDNVPVGQGAFANNLVVKGLNESYLSMMNEIYGLNKTLGVNGTIKENRMLGFFIETAKPLASPFILKQGLVNKYRYTHATIIELSSKIAIAKNRLQLIEKKLLVELQEQVENHKDELLLLSKLIGISDFINSNAIIAKNYDYHKPELAAEGIIIEDGRHPIVEHQTEYFQENSLDFTVNRNAIVTGPNMGGKSTYLKLVAIITLMAQSGMFVPAAMFKALPRDSILMRSGSGDDTSQGKSTFMVEMIECSEIVRLATKNSLVIIDEVGRGTATRDGVAIAIALLEYLFDKNRSFVLISTHYIPLAHYLDSYPNTINLKTGHDSEGNITHNITPGIASSSFGLQVAKMAGFPESIIERSQDIYSKTRVEVNIPNLKT